MVGALAILSDDPPEPARNAGFGDRFRYWRGASGRRYLFSLVPADALPDFRSVVVMVAEHLADGRLIGPRPRRHRRSGMPRCPPLHARRDALRPFPRPDQGRTAPADRGFGPSADQARSLDSGSSPSRSATHSSTASWRPNSRRWRTVLTTYSLFAPD